MIQVSFDPTSRDEREWVEHLLSEMNGEPSSSGSGAQEGAPAATPAPRTRNKRSTESAQTAQVEPFVVKNPDGEVRATFETSKDAADVIIVAGSTCDTDQQLADLIDQNLSTMARMDKADQERVKTKLAEMITKIRASAAPAPTESADLDALMGGGDEEPETQEVSADDFNKAMLDFINKAGPVGARTFGGPLIKKYGSLAEVPPEDRALVLTAAAEFLAKIKQ